MTNKQGQYLREKKSRGGESTTGLPEIVSITSTGIVPVR